MSKVICDICGTTYPATSEQCPICGYTRDLGGVTVSDDLLTEQPQAAVRNRVKGGRFSSANVRKRNRSTPSYQPQLTDDEDDSYQYDMEEQGGSNKALVVILVVLILAILAVTAFIFVKYFLPNVLGDEDTMPSTESQVQQTSETTEPTIPCRSLALSSGGSKEFTEPGQYWLLNVVVTPEDTTDELRFDSSDEKVATVTPEGRVEAVGEGEATITIRCGEKEITCFIVCVFPDPTETEPEETEPEETEPEETEPEETEPEPIAMTVAVDRLSIRSGAGTDQEKIGVYTRGQEVLIYETVTVDDAKWGRTDKGWICIDYCS